MFAVLARPVNSETLKVISSENLFVLNGLDYCRFSPKHVKDFSTTQYYGRTKADDTGVLFMHKFRIISMKASREEYDKLKEAGKLPRPKPAKYEVHAEEKVLFSLYAKQNETYQMKADARNKRLASKNPNSGLANSYMIKAKVPKLSSEQTDNSSKVESKSVLPLSTTDQEVDNFDSSSNTADTPGNIGMQVSPVIQARETQAVSSKASNASQVATLSLTENGSKPSGSSYMSKNELINKVSFELGLKLASKQAENTPVTSQFGSSSSEETNLKPESISFQLVTNKMLADQLQEVLDNQKGINEAICGLHEKIDKALNLLKGVAPSLCSEIKGAVTLDSGCEVPDGKVHFGDGRYLNSIFAESIVSSKDNLQWKVRSLVTKLFEADLKANHEFYLQMPKPEERKETDRLFPEACVEGLCNFINAVNRKLASLEIAKQRMKIAGKNLSKEEKEEKFTMIQGSVMASVENINIGVIRGILSKVLYAIRPSKTDQKVKQNSKKNAEEKSRKEQEEKAKKIEEKEEEKQDETRGQGLLIRSDSDV